MRTLITLSLLCLACGCARQQTTMKPSEPQQPMMTQPANDAAEQIRQIDQPLSQLEQLAQDLRNDGNREQFRPLMTDVFEQYGKILPILIGPEPGGAARQQMSIVDTTRSQLADGSKNLSIQPTVDAGLRAVYNALSSVYRQDFYEQGDVASAIDALRASVEELDAARQGAMHRLVAAGAVQRSVVVVKQMSAAMSARIGTTRPATQTTTTTPVAQSVVSH